MSDSLPNNQQIHELFVRRAHKDCLELIEAESTRLGGDFEYGLYVRALILRQEGKVQESLSFFQKVVEINPLSADNSKQVGKSLLLLGRYSEAINIFDTALELSPDPDWEILHNKGMCLVKLDRTDEAIAAFLEATEAEPKQPTLCALGDLYAQLGKFDDAINIYDSALKLSPENTEMQTILGLLHIKKDETEKAFEILGGALTINPRAPKTILAAGKIIQDSGDADVALTKYRIAAAQVEFAELWNNIGMCFYAKQKHQAAISCLMKARQMSPFDWHIAYNLGLLFLEVKQNMSAFLSISASISLHRQYAPTFSSLGIALSRLGDIDNAIEAYKRSISMENNHVTHLNFAISLLNHERYDECKQELRAFAAAFNTMSDEDKRDAKEIRDLSEQVVKTLKEKAYESDVQSSRTGSRGKEQDGRRQQTQKTDDEENEQQLEEEQEDVADQDQDEEEQDIQGDIEQNNNNNDQDGNEGEEDGNDNQDNNEEEEQGEQGDEDINDQGENEDGNQDESQEQ